jgi:transposase
VVARPIKAVTASAEVQVELERRAKAATSAHRDRFRAQIILLRLDGLKIADVAERMGTSMPTVSIWSSRFERSGLDGLKDKTGRGRKPSIPTKKIERVVTEVTRPPNTRTRWSVRSMGRHVGISPSSVQLCCDEKSQCQALERTQLGLPLAPKRPRTMTHDYTRHGTITLFAALSVLTGKLITRTETSHTHVEWLRFLKQIDREIPKHLQLHLIADNYATHKHPKVQAWLARHPRFKMHFTPTSSSWLNLVERFFADLTADVIRAGSFASVQELVADINAYLAERNARPVPYKWTAKGETILEKIAAPAPPSTSRRSRELLKGN